MNVLASIVHRGDHSSVKARILEACAVAGLKKPTCIYHPSAGDLFLDVLARALAIVRRGERVTVVAQFRDIVVPDGLLASQDDFSDEEWRHSWKAYLEARGVAFLAVDPGGVPSVDLSTRTSVIRSYQRATQALERAVEAARQAERRDAGEIGYFYGRPPYGYKVEKGRFVVNKAQADAVRMVFEAILAGTTGGDIIAQFGRRKEYWDRKKIRRIVDHASLYCTGTYHPKKGEPVVIPALAFLPAKWLDRLKAVQERKLAQAPTVALARSRKAGKALAHAAPVPSCAGAGTIGVNPPTGAAS
jgi:hypothetical protein